MYPPPPPPPAPHTPSAITLRRLWAGRSKPATHWRALIVSVLALALLSVSYTLALSTIRCPCR